MKKIEFTKSTYSKIKESLILGFFVLLIALILVFANNFEWAGQMFFAYPDYLIWVLAIIGYTYVVYHKIF